MSQAASGAEEITALKDLHLQTVLAEQGSPKATIVAPDHEGYGDVAGRIRKRVNELAGVELPVARPEDISYDALGRSNVILLGNAPDNPHVRRLLWERWLYDTWYPGEAGSVVRSIHNPFGSGTNVIFIGGGDPDAVGAAAKVFLNLLEAGDPLSAGWIMEVENGRRGGPIGDETIREHTERADRALEFKNGRNLISGAALAGRRYYDTGQGGWAEVFKVFMDRHRKLGEPGMGTHMNVYDAVSTWELVEESPVFTDEDRLWITNHFLYILRSGEGCMHSWMRRDIDILGPRHNHQTLPGVACLFGGRYFKLGYGLPEAEEWMETGARLFDGQEVSHKPQCDCSNYEWGTLYQMGWWSLGSGDYTFFDNGSCRAAVDRAILEMDNRGFMASNGDCWTLKYFPEILFRQAAEYYQDGRYEWALRKGASRREGARAGVADVVRGVEPQEPTDLLGIQVAPMSPQFYNASNTTLPRQPDPTIPIERSFDKISFRRTFDSEDQYLLLDGIGTGSHGHVDVNGVSQFTDNGRIWLMDVSYAEAPGMRDHNVVTVLRDGKTQDPPPMAALEGIADLETIGLCQTSLPDYCGLDWSRSIFWSKERYFLFIDRLVALEAGDYTIRVHWRTPGEGKLDGHTFSVDQQEREAGEGARPAVPGGRVDTFTLDCSGADKVALVHDRENVGKWFKSYEYSDPVVSIVQQNRAVTMGAGDTHVFANLFYTSNADEPVDVEMRSVAEGVVLVRDGERIVCAGIGPATFGLGGQEVEVKAEQFVFGADTIALRAGREVSWSGALFRSDAPADVERALDGDVAGRSAVLAKAWADASEPDSAAAARPAVESRGVRDRLLAKLDAPALCMAEGNVVGGTDGPREVAVGCADGQVHLLSREGEALWSFRAGGGINDVAIADVDGDGRGEVIVGSDDRCCYLLDSDGRARWRYEGAAGHDPYWGRYWKAGEVEKVLAADIDGDGQQEVVFAAANMHIHACDTHGELLWRFTEYGVCTSIVAADLTGDGRMEVIGGPEKITCNSTCHVIGADGVELMRSSNDGWASALTAICTADLGDGGGIQVICGTNMNNVYALGRDGDGLEQRWAYTAGDVVTSLCGATVSDAKGQHVVVGSASEFVHLLDTDGKAVWDARLGDPVTRVASADLDGDGMDEVIASTHDALYVLDGSGSVVAVFAAESAIVSFCLGEGILVVTEDGSVRVLDIAL